METETLIDGIRQSLKNCQSEIVSSIEKICHTMMADIPIEERKIKCKPHMELIRAKSSVVSTILQSYAPSWAVDIRNHLSNMESNNFNNSFTFKLASHYYSAIGCHSFEKIESALSGNDEKLIDAEIDLSDVDARLDRIINELNDIINNHGEKITAKIEKELTAIVLRIKLAKVRSLFGRKIALFVLLLYLTQLDGSSLPGASGEVAGKLQAVKNEVQMAVDKINDAEKECITRSVQGITVNGGNVSIEKLQLIIQKE